MSNGNSYQGDPLENLTPRVRSAFQGHSG